MTEVEGASAADRADSPHLTARQAAAYLHLNEKKLYELARTHALPAARVGGKWLFPRVLLDDWLREQAHGGVLTDRLLISGGDDPLLAATVAMLAAQLGSEAWLAYSPTATVPGLELLARRRANICAVHWGGVDTSVAQHGMLLRRYPQHPQWTLVRLAHREQGVMLRRGLAVEAIETLVAFDYRWAMPQAGAGSRHFLASALASRGMDADDCTVTAQVLGAREATAMLARGEIDCAPGCHAAAAEFGLGFIPLGWEALDLALPREIVFRKLFQQLLEGYGSAAMRQLAARLGGYELSALGQVLAND